MNSNFETLPNRKYDVIYADPPWRFRSNSEAKPQRNPLRHYDCLTVSDLATLPVAGLRKPDCLLFLWITSPMLVAGAHLPLLKAWGFTPSGVAFTWVKTRHDWSREQIVPLRDLHMGTGYTTRKNAEFCLIAKHGKSLRRNSGIHEIVIAKKGRHSEKPEEVRTRIEAYVDFPLQEASLLELFARTRAPGWDSWGNEVPII